jgi:hypothetical protein
LKPEPQVEAVALGSAWVSLARSAALMACVDSM